MHTTETEASLQAVAQRIRDWQESRKVSDTDLCKRYAGLGSTKTYKRLLGGDFEELNAERQLHNYESVWCLIEIAVAFQFGDEKDFDDLKHVVSARLAVTDALSEKGNNRLVIVEGASGSGKSAIGRCLYERWPAVAVIIEADETWKNSPANMFADILTGLGITSIPISAEDRKLKIISVLCARKLILIIDEAHHLGVSTLNLIKTLLNRTPTVFVFLANPTLLKRLETSAYEEALQLTRNRLCERVRINGPLEEDTLKFILRRGVKFTDDTVAGQCVKKLCTASRQHGNWNFVNLVTRRCIAAAVAGPIDQEQFVEALTAVQKTR